MDAARTKKRAVVHVALPLAIGLALYAAWRSKEVHVVSWLSRVAPRGVDAMQGAGTSRVPSRILGSLPDALWAWAFGATLALVWLGRPWREKRLWLGAGALVALGAELGQAAHVLPGTYDTADLFAIAVGYVLGATLAGRRG